MRKVIIGLVVMGVVAALAIAFTSYAISEHWLDTEDEYAAYQKTKLEQCRAFKQQGMASMKAYDLNSGKNVTPQLIEEDLFNSRNAVNFFRLAQQCPEVDVKHELKDALKAKEAAELMKEILDTLRNKRAS